MNDNLVRHVVLPLAYVAGFGLLLLGTNVIHVQTKRPSRTVASGSRSDSFNTSTVVQSRSPFTSLMPAA